MPSLNLSTTMNEIQKGIQQALNKDWQKMPLSDKVGYLALKMNDLDASLKKVETGIKDASIPWYTRVYKYLKRSK